MVYRVKEFAKLIGKSPSTLRRWEKEGKIKPKRSKGNQRYYTDKDLQIALNIESKTDCGKFLYIVESLLGGKTQSYNIKW